jgi:beta-1,3-galactosyltransferase 2
MRRKCSSFKIILFCIIVFSIAISFSLIRFTPLQHSTKHHRRNEYKFKLNPNLSICKPFLNKSILFIAFVTLAPHHFEKRQEIRSTWGSTTTTMFPNDFRVIFTIGLSKNRTINKIVAKEFKLYKDLLQIDNFTDSYYNLTTKIMTSLKWIRDYCPNAKYILRLNDDVIVNTPRLIEHFKKFKTFQLNKIYGMAFYNSSPMREKGHKFYVSKRVYPKAKYDNYVDGIL